MKSKIQQITMQTTVNDLIPSSESGNYTQGTAQISLN